MFTEDDYLILEKPVSKRLSQKLCIINFDLPAFYTETKDMISQNKDTVFWCATNDFSKKYIETASKLGIQNIVQFPIKAEVIKNFFEEKNQHTDIEFFNNYAPLKNSRILIIDDNELNIILLKETLSDLGIFIDSYMSPLEALNEISDVKYDLCLLDILMPEMSGFELAEKIKKTELNSHTPIIFISAVSGDESVLNGYNMGAYSYIEKPFSPKIVKAQIYNILKAGEQKKEQSKNNDSFIASLTHDLKSPINAEILAIKYLLENKKNGGFSESEILSELLNSAKYMKLITDKILCHYKQKNSNINLTKENISFAEVVLSSIEEMRYLAQDKNIDIHLDNSAQNTAIYLDKLEIKRVLNNLLSNAIEYSKPNSHIDIRIKTFDNILTCEVEDYGLGIDLKNYESVFDEYMTLSKEQKKVGFGLGLNICKKIINAHNGDINIKSKPNKGTKITFSLPLLTSTETMKVEG